MYRLPWIAEYSFEDILLFNMDLFLMSLKFLSIVLDFPKMTLLTVNFLKCYKKYTVKELAY